MKRKNMPGAKLRRQMVANGEDPTTEENIVKLEMAEQEKSKINRGP